MSLAAARVACSIGCLRISFSRRQTLQRQQFLNPGRVSVPQLLATRQWASGGYIPRRLQLEGAAPFADMAEQKPFPASSLDREQFKTTLHLKALRLQANQCQEFVKALKGHMLDKARLKSVIKDPQDPTKRLVLLREEITGPDLEGLPADIKERVDEARLEVTDHQLVLDYSYWPADLVLKKLLPEGVEVPSSFETVGHIAHLNIRDDMAPYKHLIGQVVLDKNVHIKTVVNKVGTITNEYRVFDMEVVAGEERFETEVVQFNTRFRLDFSKVYWNSRLEHEHTRLVGTFASSDVILDVMAGIGPFAVPAAQKGCRVYANDLNPVSYKYLQENVRINKMSKRVSIYNMDGRKFIRDLSAAGGPAYTRVVMNLPASAVEFLDAFRGACTHTRWHRRLPTVHCYTFSRGDEDAAGVQRRVEAALGSPLEAPPEVHLVREVAPNKRMLCVTFPLPPAVAYGTPGPASAIQPGSAAQASARIAGVADEEATSAPPGPSAEKAGSPPAACTATAAAADDAVSPSAPSMAADVANGRADSRSSSPLLPPAKKSRTDSSTISPVRRH